MINVPWAFKVAIEAWISKVWKNRFDSLYYTNDQSWKTGMRCNGTQTLKEQFVNPYFDTHMMNSAWKCKKAPNEILYKN